MKLRKGDRMITTIGLIIPLFVLTVAAGVLAQSTPSPASKPTTELSPAQLEQMVLEIIRRNPQVIIDSVNNYQNEQVRVQRRAEWQQQLKQQMQVDLKNAPILGNPSASLTLVEFSDFQCPYCIQAQPTLKALLQKYKGKIRLAYLHLPLSIHPEAKAAAQAAWAAGQQGKFFAYHDRLFSLAGALQPESYVQIAQDLGLDLVKFNRDRQSPQASAQIESDLQQAAKLGIQGTPSFVLNGILLRGALPIADFEDAIQFVESQKSK
jgi:protein-disulfide isomerase